ncbi:MAG: ATP-dependent DNA helicase [Candidatus Micrarchaeia archaeon]
MDKLYFRHDKPRPHQQQFIEDIYSSISESRHLLAHAPTGSGKTDSALSASLTYALEHGLTIFFITPKISQHKIVMEAVNGIAKKYGLDIKATDLVGRRYACIDPTLEGFDHDGFYLSCEKKRKKEACEFYRTSKGYSRLEETRANELFKRVLTGYGSGKTHPQLIQEGRDCSACPYEWMIKAASVSNVIVADYYHLMIPKIREIFLLKTRKKLDKSIVIIDEAHNLASRVREQMSSSVNSFIFSRAEKEMKALGAQKMHLHSEFDEWARKSVSRERELVAERTSFDEFLKAYPMSPTELADYFESLGLAFIEQFNKKSACMHFSKFLRSWETDEKGALRILRRKGEFFSLTKRFLDPSSVTSDLNKTHSAILMSGTLRPLEMHRDILGLSESRTDLKSYRSPFDENNVMNIISTSTTTRFAKRDFKNYSKIAEEIDSLVSASPKSESVAVFFPSYSVLSSVVPLIKTKNLLLQRESMSPMEVAELIKDFSAGGVLCAVQGGSLAEGIDYANEEIKTAIIVGIALEEPNLETKALIEYYQEKFGKGWEYGYTYPAVIKALQAAGRGIRKETDRSAIVFMDERFNWKNYRSILDDGRRFVVTDEPAKYVKFFWSGTK